MKESSVGDVGLEEDRKITTLTPGGNRGRSERRLLSSCRPFYLSRKIGRVRTRHPGPSRYLYHYRRVRTDLTFTLRPLSDKGGYWRHRRNDLLCHVDSKPSLIERGDIGTHLGERRRVKDGIISRHGWTRD